MIKTTGKLLKNKKKYKEPEKRKSKIESINYE